MKREVLAASLLLAILLGMMPQAANDNGRRAA